MRLYRAFVLNNKVHCGVTERLLGFSFQDENGRWRGFNVDFCRAVAVAALGDAEKASFTPLTSPNRFPILLSGKIDLLAHTATWTFGREAGIGVEFPGIYFYDGQTFAVPVEKEIKRLEDLNGMAICVEKGTTYQANMADTFKKRGIPYTPVVVDSQEELVKSRAGRWQVRKIVYSYFSLKDKQSFLKLIQNKLKSRLFKLLTLL